MRGKKQTKSTTIKQRILQFVDSLEISKRNFYEKTGISRGTLEGATGITDDTITKFITNYTNVNLVWLLTGDGDMLLSDTRLERENWISAIINYRSTRYGDKDLLRVGVRIDEICYHYGVTYKQLSQKTGFDYNELMQIINGNEPAPIELLQKIEKLCPSLSSAWMYSGKGSMDTMDVDLEEWYREMYEEQREQREQREREEMILDPLDDEPSEEELEQYEKTKQPIAGLGRSEKPKKNP
jgi:transcriptional regulator with XRE-family HTH domain